MPSSRFGAAVFATLLVGCLAGPSAGATSLLVKARLLALGGGYGYLSCEGSGFYPPFPSPHLDSFGFDLDLTLLEGGLGVRFAPGWGAGIEACFANESQLIYRMKFDSPLGLTPLPLAGLVVIHAPSLRERPRSPVGYARVRGLWFSENEYYAEAGVGVGMTLWALNPELELRAAAGHDGYGPGYSASILLRLGLGGLWELSPF